MVPIVGIVGGRNAGKTTLLEKLIPELKRRGYRVGTIKHDVHGVDIDHEGKDSWRHTQAGADTVLVSGPTTTAMVQQVAAPPSLERLAQRYLNDVDLILTEGYKTSPYPKIEVFRRGASERLLSDPSTLLAVASDTELEVGNVPCYDLNDAAGLVDLLEKRFLAGDRAAVHLLIDERRVELTPFVQRVMANTLRGLVQSLQGVDEPERLEVIIHRWP